MFGGIRPTTNLSKIHDIMTRADTGFSFIDLKENKLKNGIEEMLRRLKDMAVDDEHNLIQSPNGLWDAEKVRTYLRVKERFLELLMLLFHITGGMPARGTEIGCIKFRNSQRSRRNFYVMHGKAFFYTEYHKTRSMKLSSYHIVRYLPRRVGELAVLYLSYIRPFANLLYAQEIVETESDGDFFFCSEESQDQSWEDKLTLVMQRETKARMGVQFGLKVYRQMAHAISHVHVHAAAADFQINDRGEQVSAWQGGHSKKTSANLYGVNSAYPANLQPQLLADYWRASKAWHRFFDLDDGELAAMEEDSDVTDNIFEDGWALEDLDDDEDMIEDMDSDDVVIDPEPEDPEPWMRREEERGMRWMAEQNIQSTELPTEPMAPSEVDDTIDSEPQYATFEDGEDLYGMPYRSPSEPSVEIPPRQPSPEIPTGQALRFRQPTSKPTIQRPPPRQSTPDTPIIAPPQPKTSENPRKRGHEHIQVDTSPTSMKLIRMRDRADALLKARAECRQLEKSLKDLCADFD